MPATGTELLSRANARNESALPKRRKISTNIEHPNQAQLLLTSP